MVACNHDCEDGHNLASGVVYLEVADGLVLVGDAEGVKIHGVPQRLYVSAAE